MKSGENEEQNMIDLSQNTPPPRPISPRECKCGCGHIFHPKRKDQVYLNKQHADFDYNHNMRKAKDENRKKFEKILSSNDNILKKYFKSYQQENCAICFLDALKADGFNTANIIGIEEKDGKKYYYTYNYYYHIDVKDNIKKIKIYKR